MNAHPQATWPPQALPPQTTVKSVCPYCGTGCGLLVQVEDGRVVGVAGDPDHPANRGLLCAKGHTLADTVHVPDRLAYPLLRAQTQQPLQQVDWETALSTAAEHFARVIRRHGPRAVAFYVSGQLLTEDYYVFNKLMKGFIGSNMIDTNSRLCMSSAVSGYQRAFGADGPPQCYADLDLAKRIFIFGANPAYAHPVLFRRLEAAKAANPDVRVVVADPRRTATCSIADLHLPLRPGTDVALLLAMLNVLVWEGLVDKTYVEAHTNGWEAAGVLAQAMTPIKAGAICGLEPKDIVQAAYWFAQGPSLSFWSMGFNQSTHGTDKNLALLNLHLATGQVGQPGAGPFSLTGQTNAMGGREVGGMATTLAAHYRLDDPAHRATVARFWGVESIDPQPGLSATQLVEALETGEVKALWIACTNPLVSLPNGQRLLKALPRAQWVMVSEAYHPTDTTLEAHLVLPAAAWAEKTGTLTNSERRVSLVNQAVAPPGHAWPDWQIAARFGQKLGRALGKNWDAAFAFPDAQAVFQEYQALTAGRDLDITGLSYAHLGQAPQQWPFPAGASQGTSRLYGNGRFATPDGRAQFWPTPYLPVAEPTDSDYPFSLTTGRVRDQWHTLTRSGQVPQLLAHTPWPTVQLHPQDAEALNIQAEDLVQITSRRGAVVAQAEITLDIRPGVVFLPMHWGKLNASAGWTNALTLSAVDPVSLQPELKHAAVALRPFAPAWRATVLWRGRHPTIARALVARFPYGVWAPMHQPPETPHALTRIELAGNKPLTPENFATIIGAAMDGLGGSPKGMDTLSYADPTSGHHKRVWLQADQLLAGIWVGPPQDETAKENTSWWMELMQTATPVAQWRSWLLAPQGRTRLPGFTPQGKVVCACKGVTQATLNQAIAQGHTTQAALQATTGAGTQCGSCLPELKAMLSTYTGEHR